MSDAALVEVTPAESVALAYADRIERGEVTYDPNVAALAETVRALRAENERLQALLGLVGDTGRLEEALIALRDHDALQQTISGLNTALSSAEASPHLEYATMKQLAGEIVDRVGLAEANGKEWATSTRTLRP